MAGRIVLLLACLFLVPPVHAELSDSKRALIQELFPSATVIEDKRSEEHTSELQSQ